MPRCFRSRCGDESRDWTHIRKRTRRHRLDDTALSSDLLLKQDSVVQIGNNRVRLRRGTWLALIGTGQASSFGSPIQFFSPCDGHLGVHLRTEGRHQDRTAEERRDSGRLAARRGLNANTATVAAVRAEQPGPAAQRRTAGRLRTADWLRAACRLGTAGDWRRCAAGSRSRSTRGAAGRLAARWLATRHPAASTPASRFRGTDDTDRNHRCRNQESKHQEAPFQEGSSYQLPHSGSRPASEQKSLSERVESINTYLIGCTRQTVPDSPSRAEYR